MPNQKLPWLSFLVVAASSISGCATAYKPLGYSGGYSDVQLDPTTFRVAFSGNGFTSRERVETFLLRRCAELTIKRGYNYFAILGGDTSSANSVIQMPSSTTGSVTVVGNTAYWNGTTTPGQQIPITKYGASVAMMVYIDRPSESQGVFDARQVAAYLTPKPKVRRPQVVAHSVTPIAPAATTKGSSPLGEARVTIESTPENAEVYVDGNLVGMTPLASYPIAEGTRRIAISRKGFVTWRRDLVVQDGVATRLNAELEPSMDPSFQESAMQAVAPRATAPAEVSAASTEGAPDEWEVIDAKGPSVLLMTDPPGAVVFVNGARIGVTTSDGLRLTLDSPSSRCILVHEIHGGKRVLFRVGSWPGHSRVTIRLSSDKR